MNNFTQQRLKENEVIFRSVNENVAEFVEEQIGGEDAILAFYCECSQSQCRERIKLTTKKYKEFHSNEHQFIALAGHETPQIERIIKKQDGYNILEKFGKVPSPEAIDLALPRVAT
jgi:hypothetical protein